MKVSKKSIELTPEQMEIITFYAENNMRELKRICDPLIRAKELSQMETDELRSDAQKVLLESVQSFDSSKECTFKTYLIGNIRRSFYDWTRDRLRWKRCNLETDEDGKIIVDEHKNPIPISNVSLDAPSDDDIKNLEKISIYESKDLSEGMHRYLNSLSTSERKVANMIMEGYSISDLPQLLHMSEKHINKLVNNMKTFEKRCLINYCEDDFKEENTMGNTTMEKSKSNKMSISSIKKKIEKQTLRFNHPLQRESDQWTNVMKGNLVSDILQNNPIPALTFAEQIINGIAVIWDLDGKQRCTNACNFVNNGFKVSKNVRRGIINYQLILKDDEGNIVLDENGFPQTKKCEFDIRGKKFSDLPEELQERFLDYNFEITQYLNCSSEDIAYHIARYNDGKPMNPQQKGIINLGEQFAMAVKSISAMPFFKEMGNYTVSEAKGTNGVLDRVVVESIMTTTFLDDWKKDQSEMCKFLKENATEEIFDNFEDLVERLSKIADENTLEKFDSKNSFLWFGLFGRFVNLGEPDKRFIEFMAEFSQSLHSKKINGESFDDLIEKDKSTKDKYVVIPRLEKLVKLMNEYFDIDTTETENNSITINNCDDIEDSDSISPIEFVRDNVNNQASEDDVDAYYEMMDGYKTKGANDKSPLFDYHNELAFLGIIAYSYRHDVDLDDWLVEFTNRNITYDRDQVKNLEMMIEDLQRYERDRKNKGKIIA